MIKLAACTFDVYDDHDGSVARSLPSEMLTALKVASYDEVQRLRDPDFGLLVKTAHGFQRKLPLHDADAVKLSEVYWARTGSMFPADIRERVSAKIAAHGRIAAGGTAAHDAVLARSVVSVDASAVKQAAGVSWGTPAWGLTIGTTNYFPLHDQDLVKVAAQRFQASCSTLTPHQRYQYAHNLQKQASVLGVAIPADCAARHYLGTELNHSSLQLAIDRRKSACPNLGHEVLDALAEAAGCGIAQGGAENEQQYRLRRAKLAAFGGISPVAAVATLLNFDKLAGIDHRAYNTRIPDPFAAVFKLAEVSTIIDNVDLAKVDPKVLSQYLDDMTMAEFQQDPAGVYQSLPEPIKAVIRAAANTSMGLPPGGLPEPARPETGGGDPMAPMNPTYVNSAVSTR